jgi:hypothetical protein
VQAGGEEVMSNKYVADYRHWCDAPDWRKDAVVFEQVMRHTLEDGADYYDALPNFYDLLARRDLDAVMPCGKQFGHCGREDFKMMGLWLRATGQTLLEREEEQQAMNTEKDVIERRIANRVSMAIRWHKLTKEEQVSRFVRNDPEIQAILNGETLQEEMLHHMLTKLVDQVFEAEDVVARDLEQRLPRLRRQFGDKLVDLILEIITEQEGS